MSAKLSHEWLLYLSCKDLTSLWTLALKAILLILAKLLGSHRYIIVSFFIISVGCKCGNSLAFKHA